MVYKGGTGAGSFAATPSGVILHSSRSGTANDPAQEWLGTSNFAMSGIELGWNATIGPDRLAIHLPADQWGWNAREHSHTHLAVEFSQAKPGQPINDDQVRAFAWYFLNVLRKRWPSLPASFPTHAELPAGIRDGKTDPYRNGDAAADDLRARILAHITYLGG